MNNTTTNVEALKTQQEQNKDMTEEDEETVELWTEVPEEEWEEMKEFIDEHKETRKRSKKFYAQKVFELALLRKREFEEESGDVLDVLKD
jgi:hypothetical protein